MATETVSKATDLDYIQCRLMSALAILESEGDTLSQEAWGATYLVESVLPAVERLQEAAAALGSRAAKVVQHG